MKNALVAMLAVIAVGGASVSSANNGYVSDAVIEVGGINPGTALSVDYDCGIKFRGESIRPFMDVMPNLQGVDGSPIEGIADARSLFIISREYAISVQCTDIYSGSGELIEPECSVEVRKNSGPYVPVHIGDNTFSWEPKARMDTFMLSNARFLVQEAGPKTIQFYGGGADRFRKVLPYGGLTITGTGGVNNSGGNGIKFTLEFTCKTGQMGSMTEAGTVCEIAQY